MTHDATLIPAASLTGKTIAISVSESTDLTRLGLSPEHCVSAIAELARAILIAGGNLLYGGRLQPLGFTEIFMREVARFGDTRQALTLAVAQSEHHTLTVEELRRIDSALGVSGRMVLLDQQGAPRSIADHVDNDYDGSPAASLSALRAYMTSVADARVLVGGRLTGYQGRLPGVLEEALLAVGANQPLYVNAGFGGAAAAAARALGRDSLSWAPPNFPHGTDDNGAAEALQRLADASGTTVDTGLGPEAQTRLATTHRPGEIASLTVLGLSRAFRPS